MLSTALCVEYFVYVPHSRVAKNVYNFLLILWLFFVFFFLSLRCCCFFVTYINQFYRIIYYLCMENFFSVHSYTHSINVKCCSKCYECMSSTRSNHPISFPKRYNGIYIEYCDIIFFLSCFSFLFIALVRFQTHYFWNVIRYSGDYTDTGQMKSGQNNNGYIPNAVDYSPSPQSQTLLLRNGGNTSSSTDTSYYPNGQVPSVNSTLTRNNNRVAIDPRQDNGLPNVHGSFNSLQNSLLSEYECVGLSISYVLGQYITTRRV